MTEFTCLISLKKTIKRGCIQMIDACKLQKRTPRNCRLIFLHGFGTVLLVWSLVLSFPLYAIFDHLLQILLFPNICFLTVAPAPSEDASLKCSCSTHDCRRIVHAIPGLDKSSMLSNHAPTSVHIWGSRQDHIATAFTENHSLRGGD